MSALRRQKGHLIWLASHANMGSHIMKTTFRSLAEEGLRLVRAKKRQRKSGKLPPLVTYGGSGLTEEFKDWNWDRIRDEVYRGRGT